jgi:hypothetical protein
MTYARFVISTPSRHPGNLNAYDPGQHRYRPDYVNPGTWTLLLSFLPAGLIENPPDNHTLPTEISTYEWTITGETGDYRQRVPYTRSDYKVLTPVQVPATGSYEVTLRVKLLNGLVESSKQHFLLRDRLIVGIGDSFASGQGNPDSVAVPAADEIIMCKATSVVLVARKTAEAIAAFEQECQAAGLDALGAIPYAGKVVVGYLSDVKSINDYVNERTEDLRSWAVSVGRDVVSYVEEGGEEFLGWLGIGDGGEAAETRPHPAAWQEPKAYRSYRSGQSLAARMIETETASEAERITFLGFGRSGSEIDEGLLGPRTAEGILGSHRSIDGWTRDRGQIEEAKDTVAGRVIDAVVISIGLNDLGFSSLVKDSILRASGEKRRERIAGAQRKLDEELPVQLAALNRAIDEQLKPRMVFITEYPIGIFKEIALGTKRPCGVLGSSIPNPITGEGLNLDVSDARDMGKLGVGLNATLRRVANTLGWIYVAGVEQSCDGHGYCADESYFVSAEESCLNQGDFEGMLHPNSLGHTATRDALARALRRHLLKPDSEWLEPVLSVLMS